MKRRSCWIVKRKGAGGRSLYYIRWYGSDGRMRGEAAGGNERDAEQMRRTREHELNAGEFREFEPIRLRDFIEEHLKLAAVQVQPSTLRQHRSALKSLLHACGDRGLMDIRLRDLERWYAGRLAKVSPATANSNLQTLRGIFQRAGQRGYLKANAFDGLSRVRAPEPSARVLTGDEIEALVTACADPFSRALVILALTTGMRLGEIDFLEWEDVDLSAGLIRIRNKKEHRTKSGKARTVPLVPLTRDALMELRMGHSGYVFSWRDGDRYSARTLLRRFQAIAMRAELGKCTFHDLRRTFVSHLQIAGVGAAVAQALVGHASITTTQKHYTRILPEPLRRAPLQLAWLQRPAFRIVS